MKANASLYIRNEGDTLRRKVTFNSRTGRPEIPANFKGTYYVRVMERGIATKGSQQGQSVILRPWKAFGSLDEALAASANTATELTRTTAISAPANSIFGSTTPAPTVRLTITDAVKTFQSDCQRLVNDWRAGGDNGLSPESLLAYTKATDNFAAAMKDFRLVYMDEFSNPDRGRDALRYFKQWLLDNTERRESGKAAHTDSKKFTVIGQFLAGHDIKMKREKRRIPHDPGLLDWREVPRVKKPRLNADEIVYYTPADVAAMIAASNGADAKSAYQTEDFRDLVAVLLLTGMRDEEIQHLEWSDVIWKNGDERGKIKVQDKPAYDWRVKDHESRTIIMHPVLKARLQARSARMEKQHAGNGTHGLIFPNRDEGPNRHFAKQIARLQNRAVAKGYQFSRPEVRQHILHLWRHTFATMQTLYGEPVQNVQEKLGHSELDTTSRYIAKVEDVSETRAAFDVAIKSLAPKN